MSPTNLISILSVSVAVRSIEIQKGLWLPYPFSIILYFTSSNWSKNENVFKKNFLSLPSQDSWLL